MITSGVQHALDLAVRLLVGAGQSILVESPTYPNALVGFAARRARVLTHGLSAEPAGTASCCSTRCARTGPRPRT